jgi:hypothetical protein
MALSRPWDPYSAHQAAEVVPVATEPPRVPPAPAQAPKPAPKRRAPNRKRRVIPQASR